MKLKHALIISVIIVIGFCIIIGNIKNEDDYNLARREILLRKIGHEILLYSGDSTSRVLPVTKIHDEEYKLRFENPFAFEPDSLVHIIRESLTSDPANPDYIVNVRDCYGNPTVYGYAVTDQERNDIIPCRGRKQPSGCYVLTIKFRDANPGIEKYSTAGLLLALAILFPVFIYGYRRKPGESIKHPTDSNHSLYIGDILFDKDRKCLITSSERINLTAKENKLLFIFAQAPNQIIDRVRLQKEIWEDDGIIVGRSLDVFISRLRKKLECDPSVQLINIHGKGYKLQIDKPLK